MAVRMTDKTVNGRTPHPINVGYDVICPHCGWRWVAIMPVEVSTKTGVSAEVVRTCQNVQCRKPVALELVSYVTESVPS